MVTMKLEASKNLGQNSYVSPQLHQEIETRLPGNVAREIQEKGYTEVPNFLKDEALQSLQSFISAQSEERGALNFSLREKDLKGSLPESLAHDHYVSLLMQKICEGMGQKTIPQQYYSRMRIKLGPEPSVDELDFHFDGSFLTFTIPILLPPQSDGGGLLIYPEARPFSTQSIMNKLTRRFYSFNPFGLRSMEKSKNVKEVFYSPNSLFIFKGFTTLHATGRMNPNCKRIVLLIHSGDVFSNSFY